MANHNNTLFEYTRKTIILCSGPLKVVSTHKQLTLIIVVFLFLCFSPGLSAYPSHFPVSFVSRTRCFCRVPFSFSLFSSIFTFVLFLFLFTFFLRFGILFLLSLFRLLVKRITTSYMNNALREEYHYSQTDKKQTSKGDGTTCVLHNIIS